MLWHKFKTLIKYLILNFLEIFMKMILFYVFAGLSSYSFAHVPCTNNFNDTDVLMDVSYVLRKIDRPNQRVSANDLKLIKAMYAILDAQDLNGAKDEEIKNYFFNYDGLIIYYQVENELYQIESCVLVSDFRGDNEYGVIFHLVNGIWIEVSQVHDGEIVANYF
jgi:hypothetical protein